MQIKIIKKIYFTLLEVVISLFLISIIITFLFGFFSKILKVEKNIEVKKAKIFASHNTQIRLNHIFSNIYLGGGIDNSSLYTKQNNYAKSLVLHILFDNKIDSDPNFSLILQAKLFIDRNNNLCIKYYPRDQNITPRIEVLLKNVKKIKYQFLANKDPNLQKYTLSTVSKNICWYSFWHKKTEALPSCIYIKIDDILDFAFFLPSVNVKM